MNCADYRSRLRAFTEHELEPQVRREVEEHAHGCADCGALHRTALETTCKQIAELYDYLAGTLTPERRAVFDRHFVICSECRDYFASYRRTVELARGAKAGLADENAPLADATVQAILKARRER